MNKIFKTKYDVTTGQTKVVSELANNRQVASRVEGASGRQPKCGVFLDNFLGVFKLAPLALALSVALPNVGYTANVWIEFENSRKEAVDLNERTGIWNDRRDMDDPKNREATILSSGMNRTGADTQLRNKDFYKTVVIGSRAVGGGGGATSIGYGTIVGKNNSAVSTGESHQGTAVGYRSFAQGNESTALGNDAVAWGESAISIGSDNIGKGVTKYTKKGLAYEVWGLFRKAGKNFNYTSEYSAIDSGNLNVTPQDYQHYLNTNEASAEKYFYKTHNWAYGDSSIAIGSRNVAYGQAAVAIGTASVAQGNYSTAFGIGTYAKGNSAVAVGNETYVYANNSIGVGNEVQAINDGSMVYGYQSYAGGSGAIAIGKRALANVAPSEHFTQTVEGFSDNWYEGNSTIHALGKLDDPRKHGKNKGLDDYFLPKTQKQQGTEEDKAESKNSGAVAIGYYVYALGENSIALGRQAYSKGDRSIAIGPYAYGAKEKTAALGYGSKAIGEQSMALGSLSRAEGQNSIAIGVNSAVKNETDSIKRNGQNTIAIGNETEATMDNSVALGYKSTTKYFYNTNAMNKALNLPATLSGQEAIDLDPYVPDGSSYNFRTDRTAGIVSVGWTKDGKGGKKELGLRRIVGVAPGALDSDVATVGQLKAVQYINKEGLVVYYTEEGSGNNKKITKLVKKDNKFYRVNTRNGEPLVAQGEVTTPVLVGAKGLNERIGSQDLGKKIRFGHLEKGEISETSDQAITGAQLDDLKGKLGLTVNKGDPTKFDKVQFDAVNVTDPKDRSGVTTNFKDALTKAIGAINRGYKFSADQINGTDNNTPFYLGATIEIKAGDVTKSGNTTEKYLGKNLQTKIENKNSEALFTIGLKDDPEFKTVKLTGNPTDGQHAVNKAYVDNKLQNVSTNLHFLSVQGNDKAAVNYNNDGAKANYSVAIGVNAQVVDPATVVPPKKTKPTATAGIAIGYNAKSEAENAVAIGRDVSIDVPNSFVMGSNNTVTQNFKDTNGAVVVIGSGTKLVESKSSIAIGAVYKVHQGKADGTLIENAAWTASIGNKNKIKNGTDIVALGNNIQALDTTGEAANNGTKNANTELILIGNASKATSAKESVIIGAKAEAELKAKQAVIIGHSAKAETNAVGAVAIGQGATVKTDAGNSIALGQGSEATAKEEAKKDATVAINGKNIKFKWSGGVSSSDRDKKSVLSIGKAGNERIIKHVAAGAVDKNSTDAINGSQLYAVADEFSKLSVNVLGAEVDTGSDRTGFKKSTFDVAKYQGSTNTPAQKEMTFKAAIAQNTTAINKGFIFGVGDQDNEYGTHYLGDKLIIKAGAVDKPSTTQDGGYVSDNIKTAYLPSKKEIVIGIKESPSFKNVLITEEIPEDTSTGTKKDTYDNYAVNKKYLDKRLEKVAANFTVKGDNSGTDKEKVYTLDKDHNELNINGDNKNITTEVDKASKKVSIKLKDALTGITSIANNDTKIELKNNGGKSIVFTSGDNSKSVTLTGDKFSGVSEIGKDDQAKITFNSNGQKEIDFKAGSTTYKFTDSGLDLANKPITNLASGLDQNGSGGTNVRQGLDELLKLIATNGQPSGSSNDGKLNKAINAGDLLHVANELKNKGLTFQGNGDDDKVTRKLGETLKIVGETSSTGSTQTTETAAGNITVAKKNGTTNEADTLEIKLSKNLKGIGSVANSDDVKIELKTTGTDGSGSKSIVFTAGDNSKSVTLTGDKFSGVSEISGKNSKSKLTLGADNATVELAHDKSKLELKDTEATITAGGNAGSIKITSNGDKKIELSPENGAKLTLAKDNGSSNVKATGLSHVGLNEQNALIFKNGSDKSAELKVDGKSLTFKKSGDKVQISGLSSGLTDIGSSSTGTSGNNSTQKLDELLKLKPQPSGTSNNQDKLSRAVNVEDLLDIAQGLVDKGLKFQGNDTLSTITTKLGGTLKIVGEKTATSGTTATTQITTAPDNITVKKKSGSDDTLEIGLSDALKGITSISGKNGSNGSAVAKIEFNSTGTGGTNATPNVKITAGGGTFTFGDNGLDLGNKKITKLESGLGLNGTSAGGGAGGNGNADIIKKILEGNPDGTTGGGNSTSIANNAVNVKDLSEVAQAIVTKGLTFAGNTGEAKAALGDKITIKGDGTYLTSKASSNGSKEIEFSLTDKVTNKLAIINVGNGSTNGDNSFALGKDSKWEAKKTALAGTIQNTGQSEVKISWKNAGASADAMEGSKKEVVSIGKSGAERIITHVAAGDVKDNSTDAINGGQLYNVIQVFGKLGTDVLGAEKNDNKDGFKKTTFTALKNTSGANEATKDTFKDAINANTAKINEGLKFKGDNGGDKQLYLGSTLTIKGAETTAQTSTQGAGAAKHQNITTTAKDGGILEIALNTNLKDITSIGKDENNVLTFKNSTSGGNSADLKVGGASLTFTKTDDSKVKITGLADGTSDGDAVTVKQLTASKLHYLSVKGPNGTQNGENYNNDGAKAQNSIAIGSKASVKDEGSHDAIAIGYNSLVENAKWSMAIGANTQAKSIQSLALGYETKVLENSDASIAIGVDRTQITGSKWSIALGNNIKIASSGDNVVALGSNIDVGTNNADLIVIGNGNNGSQQIQNAKNSVIIGKHAISQAESAVVIGKGANVETNATGAVAIGDSAKVESAAGDSIALGKNSVAKTKQPSPAGLISNSGTNDIKITWRTTEGDTTKSVFSVGSSGNERIITNVADGKVDTGSTDAINGGQLKSVIDVFANLGVSVLGAEKADSGDGFKQTAFTKLKDETGQDTAVKAQTTFKGAIEESIKTINKGLKFAGDQGNEFTRQLGATVSIKGAKGDASSPTSASSAVQNGADNHQNIFTTAKAGTLEIALNKDLKGIQSIANGEKAKIALDKDEKTITFSSGEKPESVTLKGSTFSGVSEINKADGKGALKLEDDKATVTAGTDKGTLKVEANKATLESAKDKSKLELTTDSATLSAGKNKGSIKVTNNGTQKIELSPENGTTLELAKDTAKGGKVKATGLSTVGLDGDNTLVFKNGTGGTDKMAELKVGGRSLTFTKSDSGIKLSGLADGQIGDSSNEAITGKQLHALGATYLGLEVEGSDKTKFKALTFNPIKGGTSATSGTANSNTGPTTFKGAIDQLITAVNGGLTFKGNDNASSRSSTTLQLGGTLTIDSSTVGSGANGTTEKDITVSLAPNDKDVKDAGTLTLKLNKATEVKEGDEKVVTSKAVATELKKYTTTADLDKGYLKVDGSNIGKDDEAKKAGRKTFGKNVGIAEIKLGDTEKSSTELVQADAVIKYLKGKGQKSVKVSDNPETEADGEGAIAIGDKAVAKNEGAIAIGYDTSATNRRSVAIGREAQVLGEHATAIGYKNNVSGNDSGAFGKDNKISGTHAYAVGAYNDIKGEHTYVLGSSVTTDDKVKNAVILGNQSTGVSDAVSVGSADKQRRIVYVADPKNQYDAVNKQYVDGLGLNFKGNDDKNIHKKLSQTLEIVGKGLNKAQTTKFKGTNGNIAVKENKEKLEISLNRDLKGIKSISDSKNKNIATEIRFNSKNDTNSISNSLITNLTISSNGGTFEFNRKGLHINNKQITGLRSGLLEKHNGQDRERKDLNYLIGDEFKNSSIQTHAVNVGDLAKISKEIVEKGYKYKADIPSNNSNDTSIKLGSTISIVKLSGTSTNGAITSPQPSTPTINIGDYKGDNLITRYTRETNGNAKIEIGFKNAPTFSKVTLSQAQTYGNGSRNIIGDNDLISKSYLEAALSNFKIKVVNGNGQAVEIGRGDTLKFNAGQNIDIKVNKNGAAQQSADMGSASASVSASAPTPTTASKPSGGANSADSMASSSAVPSGQPASPTMPAGTASNMASSGSSPSAAPTISQPTTGTQNGSDTSSMTSSTSSNTAPSSDTGISSNTTAEITIATTEELKNITSISSKPKNSGSSAGGNQDEVTKLTLDPTDGATFQVDKTGSKVNINKDGISLMPQGANGANSSPAETPSIVIKAGAKPVDKNSLESFEKDQGPSIAFSTKDTDGKKIGSGKITGLADIKEGEKDGTIAVNKNYVDKLDKVTVKYDDEHKKSITLGGKPQNGGKAHDPVAINNLKSGLGLDDMKDKPDSQKNGLSLELVKKLVSDGMSSQQGQKMTEQQDLHQAANLADLKAVAQAGLRFKGNQGDDVVRKISDTLIIKGEEETQNGQTTSSFSSAAGNIKVETNTAKDGLEIKLSDTLKNMKAFETKEEGDKKSTLNSDGLTVVNKNGSNNDKSATYGADNIMLEDKKTGNKATITAESLTFADNVAQNQQNPMPKAVLNKNGLTVTGKGGEIKIDGENGIITVPDIKPTTSESAVVNKKYVDTLQRQTDQKLGNLEHKLDMSNKELRAGVAQAVAQANLPVNILPGKSTLSLATGNYMGSQAFAVGYSRVSDNGKLSVKFSLGHGDKKTSVGAGIGYSW
ncbi:YadA-like family protein [Histophilus somni]|uniref:YadA-like family protein n=2 Tax=Histophilus somni TaxID=731 RepID=UPI00201F461A|nr:YadA-like family protein [Histophilus somni]